MVSCQQSSSDMLGDRLCRDDLRQSCEKRSHSVSSCTSKHRSLPNVMGPGSVGASDWQLGNLDTLGPRHFGRSHHSQRQPSTVGSGDTSYDARSVSVTSRSRIYEGESPPKSENPHRVGHNRSEDKKQRTADQEFTHTSSVAKEDASPRGSNFSSVSSVSAARKPGRQWRSSSCTRLGETIPTLEAALLPPVFNSVAPEQRQASSMVPCMRKSHTRMPLMPYETLPTPARRLKAATPTRWFPHPSACLPPGASPHESQAIFCCGLYDY